ncbi:MAG: YqaJ viral recombinase family protein, partial [Deltaproteobacteria bacterium]|nr:YqaJ viral recombinase family protein [Deltaproteobacteria bacterium]
IKGVTSLDHVLEIKSANSRRFKAFRESGVRAISREYYCQVQCYMGYSGLERALCRPLRGGVN